MVILDGAAGAVEHLVARGTGGDVLVDWRHLFIPADTQATALGNIQVELHTEHASGTGGGDETGVAVGAELFSHDELDDEVVLDFQTAGGLHVANGVGCRVDAGFELHANFTASGVKVCLPAVLLFVVANDAGLLVENTLALATDLVGVLLAGCGHNLLVLLDAPHHLTQTPAGLSLLALVHDTTQSHLNGELANGVDHRGKHNTAGQVGGGKDANGGLVVSRDQSAADVQWHLEVEFLAGGSLRVGSQEVLDLAQGAIAGCGEVTREEVAEGEVVGAGLEREVFSKEVPVGELVGAREAVGAVVRDGLLGAGLGDELGVELSQRHFAHQFADGDAQTARKEGTGRGSRSPVADQRRRFHQDFQGGGWRGNFVLAQAFLGSASASEAAALFLAVITVRVNQVIH